MNTPVIYGADPNVPGWDWGDRSVEAVRRAKYTPDEHDIALLQERADKRLTQDDVLVGDYVEFADGVTRRVSYVMPMGVQTSDGGSFHLMTDGGGNFSGSLHPPVARHSLSRTDETRPGEFWFFHHAHMTAHNAVYARVDVRVWQCTEPASRSRGVLGG